MGRVALVTGASQGIGKAIACRLAADGFHVAINDLSSCQEDVNEVCEQINQQGFQALGVIADVSDELQVKEMIKKVVNHFGSLDVMVANAAICITKPFIETPIEDFRRTYAVNMEGVFNCYKYSAIQMIQQGHGGRIIGASSVGGRQGWPLISAYCATKFAVVGLTQSAACELGKYNITVNAYAPGGVDTSLNRSFLNSLTENKWFDEPSFQAQRKPVLGNALKPSDIAALVSYLASNEAAGVTGQTISVDGGLHFN